MPAIYRQKRFSALTPEQQQLKLQKDAEYEQAVSQLSDAFYTEKRTTGVTAAEEQEYISAKANLWQDYLDWAIANGLYEEVPVEQQLENAMAAVNNALARANSLRAELGQPLIEVS